MTIAITFVLKHIQNKTHLYGLMKTKPMCMENKTHLYGLMKTKPMYMENKTHLYGLMEV